MKQLNVSEKFHPHKYAEDKIPRTQPSPFHQKPTDAS